MAVKSAKPKSQKEVERKYEGNPKQGVPSLSGLPGVRSEQVTESTRLRAEYYDTSDHKLLSLGVTLRRRTGGDDAGWHLKVPIDTDSRTEIHLPLSRNGRKNAGDVPAEFDNWLTGVLRGDSLRPVATVRTVRKRWQLFGEPSTKLAELASDTVVASRVDDADSPELRWRELEVELGDGDTGLFDDIEVRLREAGFTRSASHSKLGRVFGNGVDGPKLSNPLANYLNERRVDLLRADILVRKGEGEAVHHLRVAARRIRSVVGAFADHFGEQEVIKRQVVNLRWLSRCLAAARDSDVQWKRITKSIKESRGMPHRETVRARVDEYFSDLSDNERSKALDSMSSEKYLTILTSLDCYVRALSDRGDFQLSEKAADRIVEDLVEAVDKRVDRSLQASDSQERDEETHSARKRAKELRYVLEAARQFDAKLADNALAALKSFQDVLGEHQDAVVARQHFLELIGRAEHSAISNLGIGILFEKELARGESLEAQLKPTWEKAKKQARKLWK